MKKITCIKCNKYRKIKNCLISTIFDKTLDLSIIGYGCGSNDEKICKKEEPIEVSKALS